MEEASNNFHYNQEQGKDVRSLYFFSTVLEVSARAMREGIANKKRRGQSILIWRKHNFMLMGLYSHKNELKILPPVLVKQTNMFS